MKNFVFTCCLLIAAMIQAKAQVAKADFDKQIMFFKGEVSQHTTNNAPLADTRQKIVNLMNQQIDYTTNQHKDPALNEKCATEKRLKEKGQTACYQLEVIHNTLTKEKDCLNKVNSIADKDIYGNKDMLLQQFNVFDSMLK